MSWTRVIRSFIQIPLMLLILTSPVPADNAIAGEVETDATQSPDTVASLGISRMECRCSYTVNAKSGLRFWSFEAEPRIRGVDRDGPAHGILEPGDAIVAIDGALITTHEAGKRFANIAVGEPVELTVRRRSSLVDVSIVPAASRGDEEVTMKGASDLLSEDLLKLRAALEQMSAAGVELDALADIPGAIDLPELDLQPLGWFGFGLSFSGTRRRLPDGKGARWDFDSPPEVHSLTPDGPAQRAGLQAGDLLTHIDGVRLDTKRGGGIFSKVVPGQSVEFEVERDGWRRSVVIVAEERP